LEIKPIKFIEEEDIHALNSINYIAPVLLTQGLLSEKLLLPKASIIFITSIAASVGAIGFGIYSGTKGALTAFARVLALETASQKMRVNAIAPGMVRTPMFDTTTDALSKEALDANEKLYPLGFVSPDDVANGVQFLLSDASEKITGTTLTIDGGFSIS
jgi:NAD(P)-dependent dehydrogenase (short-subunit alcohol dehydrogenase family)